MYSVGQIISTYRKKEKLTQPQLAKKLADDKIHLSYKTISTWEKNISEPKLTFDKQNIDFYKNPFSSDSYYALLPISYYQKLTNFQMGKKDVCFMLQ